MLGLGGPVVDSALPVQIRSLAIPHAMRPEEKKKKDGATVETSKSRRMAALDSNAGSLGSSGGHINKALISLGHQWFLALSGSWSALHAMCAC